LHPAHRQDVERVRAQWQAFVRHAPPYPVGNFSGRGIVTLAGGLRYTVPAWVNVHMLRRTGCTLPVEMFFPEKEFPTSELQRALARLGVSCRKLRVGPDIASFALKAAALLGSSFEEVGCRQWCRRRTRRTEGHRPGGA
jgi:alpha 1,2-mannosyltransferase